MFSTKFKNVAFKFNLLIVTFFSVLSLTANAASTDAFSHLEMRNQDDSVFLMDTYNRLMNDKKFNSPVVQQNKQEILRIVNVVISAKKSKDSVDYQKLVMPDCKQILSHRFEEVKDSIAKKSDGENLDVDLYNAPSTEYKTFISYLTQNGDTVEKDIEYIDYAEKLAEQIERVNRRYSSADDDFRYGDILLTAFNMALQGDTIEMERFRKETEQKYIKNELAKYNANGRINNELAAVKLNTKADSISFAQGYFTGKSTADTLSFKDNYNFLEGLTIGYEARKNNIGKIGWLQIINIMESKPLASQPLFMLGIEVGGKGEKDGYEPSFIAGAYYGYAGERTQWQPNDMAAYLKKNVLDANTLFGTWVVNKVEIIDNGNKITDKDRRQSTKDILKYKLVIVDDHQYKFNKGTVKQNGEYSIRKNELHLFPFSSSFAIKEDKTVAEMVSDEYEFQIISRTEKEMVLGTACRNCFVIIHFRKK